jgi:hypothetical protein
LTQVSPIGAGSIPLRKAEWRAGLYSHQNDGRRGRCLRSRMLPPPAAPASAQLMQPAPKLLPSRTKHRRRSVPEGHRLLAAGARYAPSPLSESPQPGNSDSRGAAKAGGYVAHSQTMALPQRTKPAHKTPREPRTTGVAIVPAIHRASGKLSSREM